MTPAAAVQVNVMVVFYSRYGATEKLALAGGLGAIQARGNLRLRRLADLADPKQIAGDAEWSTNLQRMSRETGGGFFEVTKKQTIDQIFDAIQAELRGQYSLGYVSDVPVRISEFRKLQLILKPKGLSVQARDRYWAQR